MGNELWNDNTGALWAPLAIRVLVAEKLVSITCEGETILITLPVDHRIGTDIQAGMLAVTILGACVRIIIISLISSLIIFRPHHY